MKNLRKGLALFSYLTREEALARLSVNRGTINVSNLLELSQYCSDAYLPDNNWFSLETRERRLFSSPDHMPSNTGDWIGLFKIPDEIIGKLNDLKKIEMNYQGAIELLGELENEIERLKDYLKGFSSELVSQGGVAINPIGLPTVTFNKKRNCFIGLHIDSWYAEDIEQRNNSKNRIVVNLGSESRGLLFVNIRLLDIYNMVKDKDPEYVLNVDNPVSTKLAHRFFEYYPEYPISKLTIAPNEAYIAPTENLIHDGTTLNKKHLDFCFHLRGNFAIDKFSAIF